MDVWRREAADTSAGSQPPPPPPPLAPPGPPPSGRRPVPQLIPSPPPRRFRLDGWSACAGAVLATIAVFAHGWPPGDGVLVALALIPVVVGGVVYARTRSVGAALGHGALAGVGGVMAATIIVPAWGFLEFLECWMSWLSNC